MLQQVWEIINRLNVALRIERREKAKKRRGEERRKDEGRGEERRVVKRRVPVPT
jgi:hypothetical protein